LQFSYTYELPIGKGKLIGGSLNPILNGIVGGWRTNGIWRFNSGRPIEPMLYQSNSPPDLRSAASQPHRHATSKWRKRLGLDNQYFTSADGSDFLAQPVPFTLGTAPRTLGKVTRSGREQCGPVHV